MVEKRILLAFILITLYSCRVKDDSINSISNVDDTTEMMNAKTDSLLSAVDDKALIEDKQSTLRDTGIVKINLYNLYWKKDTLRIYNLDESLYATLTKSLIINDTVLDIKESDLTLLKKYIGSMYFYPEYDIFIADYLGKYRGKYKIELAGSEKLIDNVDELLQFQSIEDHVLSSYIVLNETTPLLEKPYETANRINGYKDYSYIPIEIRGDWLRVKCDKDCEGCPKERALEGWVKWKNNDNLLIELYYIC